MKYPYQTAIEDALEAAAATDVPFGVHQVELGNIEGTWHLGGRTYDRTTCGVERHKVINDWKRVRVRNLLQVEGVCSDCLTDGLEHSPETSFGLVTAYVKAVFVQRILDKEFQDPSLADVLELNEHTRDLHNVQTEWAWNMTGGSVGDEIEEAIYAAVHETRRRAQEAVISAARTDQVRSEIALSRPHTPAGADRPLLTNGVAHVFTAWRPGMEESVKEKPTQWIALVAYSIPNEGRRIFTYMPGHVFASLTKELRQNPPLSIYLHKPCPAAVLETAVRLCEDGTLFDDAFDMGELVHGSTTAKIR